jgi:hypothetical protein
MSGPSTPPTTPAPGGVPAHQPQPEVPARDHPLPSPQEVPVTEPAGVPVEAPSTPGPAAVIAAGQDTSLPARASAF